MATSITELRQAASLPARQAGTKTVRAFFESKRGELQAVLPKHMSLDRMLRIAIGALRTTPKLTECTVESLFGAIVTCSQLGLEPNTPMGHAYLIPFANSKMNRTDVQLIIGYKGLVDLARRSGQIESISARLVHRNDEFDVEYGTVDEIRHRPTIFGEPGEVIGVYAVGKLRDGGRQFEFMSVADINKIRDGSQGYKNAIRYKSDNPWISHWPEMARKSVIRRLCKYLPMSIELATAAAIDGAAVAGKTPDYSDALQGEFTIDDPDAPTLAEPQEPPPPVAHQPKAQQPRGGPSAPDRAGTPERADRDWPQQRADQWLDSTGEVFDPDRHAWSSENNRPAVRADGTFRARRGTARQPEDGAEQGAAQPAVPDCPDAHRDLLADLRSIRDEHGIEPAMQALADADGVSDDDRALLGDLLKS